MANNPGAKKAIRKIAARTEVNKARRTRVRTFLRKFQEAVTGGDAGAWMKAAAQVYTEASDEHFWHAEAALASLEKSGQA